MAIYDKNIHFSINKSELKLFDIHKFVQEHPLLSKRLGKDGILFESGCEAPSPSKDYGHIQINIDQVIIRWWKITLKNIEGSIYPGEIKNSYEDFLNDERAQREINRIFGKETLNYCFNIIHGHIDWFKYLPFNIKIKIFSFVNLDDIPQLALVSKLFRLLSRHNDLWKIFYLRQHGQQILNNKYFLDLVQRKGWRQLFFTNRLKLQMELRRQIQIEINYQKNSFNDDQCQEEDEQLSIINQQEKIILEN